MAFHWTPAIQQSWASSWYSSLIPDVRNLSVVESIDSLKLATKLNTLWSSRPKPLRIFVQVNTSGEESKSGVPPEKTVEIVEKIVQGLPKLEFAGLMSIGSPEQNDFSDFKVRTPSFPCVTFHNEPGFTT